MVYNKTLCQCRIPLATEVSWPRKFRPDGLPARGRN
jgi:hypothetical protein